MKHMTNEQIDEINILLEHHGEALTAFYDEGISYGMSVGAKAAMQGTLIGVAIIAGIEIILLIKKHKESKGKSR